MSFGKHSEKKIEQKLWYDIFVFLYLFYTYSSQLRIADDFVKRNRMIESKPNLFLSKDWKFTEVSATKEKDNIFIF